MGVWIEIEHHEQQHQRYYWSLPAWECGLKSAVNVIDWLKINVTPCVGVWIEITCLHKIRLAAAKSLPVWECGLKFAPIWIPTAIVRSLPAWECGLK